LYKFEMQSDKMWLSGTAILHVTVEIISQVLCVQQTSTSHIWLCYSLLCAKF